jgi:hypothetical protein
VKGVEPGPADLLKAVFLSEGSGFPMLIATGAPWFDTRYALLTGEDINDSPSPPFLESPRFTDAIVAARSARFEFGETPAAPMLFSRKTA